MCTDVTLAQVLEARDVRAARQTALLRQYGMCVVSLCMNIAGPVKNDPLIRRAFQEGIARLTDALLSHSVRIVHQEQTDWITGCEALVVTDGTGEAVKRLCIALEDADPLGRLLDLDVLTPEVRWDRQRLGASARNCLVCGKPGKDCASRRLHSVETLQKVTWQIMEDFFAQQDRQTAGALAAKALLYEACTTPKPGLVDRLGSGSHRDMDLYTFLDSTAALMPYLCRAFAIGQETARQTPQQTFLPLRAAGLRAEREMKVATGGVNTHKGAIFSLGIVCAAAGRLWQPDRPWAEAEEVLAESGRICADAVQEDLNRIREAGTAGQRIYKQYGIAGIRGEAAQGLPSVGQIGLPVLQEALQAGATLEQAGSAVLLRLIAKVTDTNLIARGGMEGQRWAAEMAGTLSELPPDAQKVEAFAREMIRRNLSPGGCADLLAITYFLYFYGNQKGQRWI